MGLRNCEGGLHVAGAAKQARGLFALLKLAALRRSAPLSRNFGRGEGARWTLKAVVCQSRLALTRMAELFRVSLPRS